MLLAPDQIASALTTLPGWALEGKALTRTYRMPSFADAIAFVTRLAFEAEAHDHHPDMLVSYRNVTVTWSTHSAGGVTGKDVDGARQTDRIRAGMAPDGT
jgi:4a-hydroxytetrahydrobiopterin dehydratase